MVFDRVRAVFHRLVEERVAIFARLLENGLAHHVAAFEFFNEALPFLIDEDGAFKARVVDQFDRARNRVAHRIGLDLFHVDGGGAHFFGHEDAVALRAGQVRRLEALAVEGIELGAQRHVRAEAARRDDDALLGVHLMSLAVDHGLDARDAAVLVTHEFGDARFGEDRNLALRRRLDELIDEFRARRALRNEGALHGVASEVEEIVFLEFDADRVAQPQGRRQGVFDENAHDGRVTQHVAALHRVLKVLFDAVLDAELLLHPVVGGRVFRARDEGVAAERRHLFEHHDLRACVVRRDGGGEARAARTDHDHVVAVLFGDLDFTLRDDERRRGERHARFVGRGLDGGLERIGRERGARNRVDGDAVAGNDRFAQVLVDLLREDGIFLFLDDADVRDLVLVKGHGHRNVAVLPRSGAFKGLRGRCARRESGRGKSDRQGRQKELMHTSSNKEKTIP